MLSKFFIDRPVFATVLAIIITLSGVLAMRSLPISQYPDVVPPEVVVRANYPGASAEDIAKTVAAPLETEINGVQNMIYMTSTSSDSGQMQLNVTFKIGTEPEQATIDVNNRVQSALSQLPDTVQQTGVTVRKQSTSILQVVTLYSPNKKFDTTYISNYMLVYLIDPIKRLDGVGDARLFSTEDYSMRIWLDPAKMARFDITASDVESAIREQNSQFAAGKFGERPYGGADIAFTYTASTAGRFSKPSQFENIILKSLDNGRVLRLKDVARVELGAQSYATLHSFNGQPAVPAAIYLQPGANALATAERVRHLMEDLGKNLPQGLEYKIPYNTTQFVHASIEEVIFTFFISLILVLLVIYLFLQNFWATIIPMLAVPVAVVGTFAGIYMLGFSINLLTLFGMILAIGLVVDDAIIVIENIERIMTEEKAPPRQAAIKAMEEVTGPVIAVVLALNAVFVPVGFLGGLSGQMYSQFAITIAVSVLISGFVALTLTPALCALFLKPSSDKKNWFFRKFNQGFDKCADAYLWGVNFLLKRAILGLLLFAGVIGATWFFSTQVPSGLIPQEDQGYIFAYYQLPPGASLQRTEKVSQEFYKKARANMNGLSGVVSVPGYDFLASAPRTWAGVMFLTLEDWGKRDSSSFDLVNQAFGLGAQVPGAQVIAFNPPPIIGLSTTGGFEGYVQSKEGSDYNALFKQTQKLIAAANKRPELQRVRTTLNTDVPRYKVTVDREKAKELGVPIGDLFSTLQSTFGQLYVNQFTFLGRNWQVNLQSDAAYRMQPDDLRQVFVKSNKTDEMIPVSSLVSTKRTTSADVVQRFNVFPAAQVQGAAAPGYSSGQANAAIQQVASQVLGSNYDFAFTGTAYQAQHVGDAAIIALVFGVVMVFLILAAQYEKWSLPIAVLTAVPFATLGAYMAVWLRGVDNNIYFTVGLLVLIGLAAKNAILIVEFAVLERQAGKSPADAAYSAAKLRFRPIVMTSMTFVLASVPLAVASGAAANSRIAIGTAVIGGMLFATFFAILFVPMFYDLIEKGSEKLARARGKTQDEDENDEFDDDSRQLSHDDDQTRNREDDNA
ncbi:efflux RND transporter permease subunit [Salinisphaera sp. Q1T1-3]|uniref:efflux RND transporter permease subunit n=1 Tax=Salinisphaera sp. Q1T1-3 TaxID=2321229 RepID=UPI000E7460E7|nr:multidrug efflux RND transporter permease subunit [Salinisphaera sp. Q1T1-3]RJS94369.1 multidrug efflux RND transporter permease subunit [Salinisphaera sp. Q1T1-3]